MPISSPTQSSVPAVSLTSSGVTDCFPLSTNLTDSLKFCFQFLKDNWLYFNISFGFFIKITFRPPVEPGSKIGIKLKNRQYAYVNNFVFFIFLIIFYHYLVKVSIQNSYPIKSYPKLNLKRLPVGF